MNPDSPANRSKSDLRSVKEEKKKRREEERRRRRRRRRGGEGRKNKIGIPKFGGAGFCVAKSSE